LQLPASQLQLGVYQPSGRQLIANDSRAAAASALTAALLILGRVLEAGAGLGAAAFGLDGTLGL